MHFFRAEAKAGLHQVIGFTDELHVAVLDAVVDHLHVMACAIGADPVAAGCAVIDLGGDGLENFLHVRPCSLGAAGHYGRAMAGAFLTSADARADEQQATGLDVFSAANGVLV